MKNKLEQLFISLIEKGWRIENPNARISDVKYMYGLRELRIVYETDRRDAVRQYPIRFLVSKESGLWQFVCENDLYPPYIKHRWFRDLPTNGLQIHDYRYWVIESALCDENKLEDFLLSNIKVGNED